MDVLQEFIQYRQLTQSQLARQLGYHRQYISNLVNGRSPITDAFVGKIARVYGVDAASLFLQSLTENSVSITQGEPNRVNPE